MNCGLNKISLIAIFNKNKKRFLREPLAFLKMDKIDNDRENVTKFLGVLIDENLSWKQQINDVSTKISKDFGILYKSRRIAKQPLLKQLYFSFIHCHLNYGNIAWGNTCKSKLEGLLTSILRVDLPMPNHYFMT